MKKTIYLEKEKLSAFCLRHTVNCEEKNFETTFFFLEHNSIFESFLFVVFYKKHNKKKEMNSLYANLLRLFVVFAMQ